MEDSSDSSVVSGVHRRTVHSVESLLEMASEASGKKNGSPVIRDLVAYVGEHILSDDVVELLERDGYRQSDIISPHYDELSTRCFTRRKDDGFADILLENPENMLCLPLGDDGVKPLYYLNYLRVRSYDVEKYHYQFRHLLEGGQKSSSYLFWAYGLPGAAAVTGCSWALKSGDWKVGGAVALGGLTISLLKLGWNTVRGYCALRDLLSYDEDEMRARGIEALMLSFGRMPESGRVYSCR